MKQINTGEKHRYLLVKWNMIQPTVQETDWLMFTAVQTELASFLIAIWEVMPHPTCFLPLRACKKKKKEVDFKIKDTKKCILILLFILFIEKHQNEPFKPSKRSYHQDGAVVKIAHITKSRPKMSLCWCKYKEILAENLSQWIYIYVYYVIIKCASKPTTLDLAQLQKYSNDSPKKKCFFKCRHIVYQPVNHF